MRGVGAPLLLNVPKVVIEISALPFLSGYLQINRLELFQSTIFFLRSGKAPCAYHFGFGTPRPSGSIRLYADLSCFRPRGSGKFSGQSGCREGLVLENSTECSGILLLDKGATTGTIKGIATSGERAGLFDVSGRVDSTPFKGGEWRGHVRVRMSACPILPFCTLAAYTRYDLPFSAGILSGTAEITGRTPAFKVKGNLALYQAVLLPGRTFRGKAPVAKAALKFSLKRLNDNLHIDVSEAMFPGLSLSGRATIGGLSTTDPALGIALRKADLDLQEILSFIPLNLMRKEDRERLVAAGLKGHLLVTRGCLDRQGVGSLQRAKLGGFAHG